MFAKKEISPPQGELILHITNKCIHNYIYRDIYNKHTHTRIYIYIYIHTYVLYILVYILFFRWMKLLNILKF